MMADGKPRGGARQRPGRRRSGNKHPAALKSEDAAERKETLEAAVRRKIEFEKKALYIVEQLLEENISEEFLLNCGRFITPSHYKDVVDERSIIKLCGYPLCQRKLENVPKQKYRISTKTNRVYDITERKDTQSATGVQMLNCTINVSSPTANVFTITSVFLFSGYNSGIHAVLGSYKARLQEECFCSNFCYRASKYFEAQISRSPVWMREEEEEKPPDIELLKEGQSGQSGKEVKLRDDIVKTSDIENPRISPNPCESGSHDTASDSSSDTEQEFVSCLLPGGQSSVDNFAQHLHKPSILKKKSAENICSSPKTEDLDVVEATAQLSKCSLGAQGETHTCSVPNKTTVTPSKTPTVGKSGSPENYENSHGSRIVFLGVGKRGAEHLKRTLANSKLNSKGSVLDVLKQTLKEWRTEETLKFLYGPGYISSCSPDCTSASGQENEELDEDDLDTPEDLDAVATGQSENSLNYSLPFTGPGGIVKPVPSYEKLKEEMEFLELRVKEFYKGKCVLGEEAETHAQAEEHPNKDQDDQQENLAFPLVDSNAQMQIRKRIVLEKLRKVLPAVLGPLQITTGDVYTELKNLVKTFRLTNTNIIHKMPEWTLIAVALLSVLSQNTPLLKNTQASPMYTQFLTTLLEELHLKKEDLESLTRIFGRNSLNE